MFVVKPRIFDILHPVRFGAWFASLLNTHKKRPPINVQNKLYVSSQKNHPSHIIKLLGQTPVLTD